MLVIALSAEVTSMEAFLILSGIVHALMLQQETKEGVTSTNHLLVPANMH